MLYHSLINPLPFDRQRPLHRNSRHGCFLIVHLNNARQHGVPLLLVLVRKLLSVPPFLLLRPRRHLRDSHDDEYGSAPAPIDCQYAQPGNRLKQVIRAGYPVEAEARWYTSFGRACAAQISQDKVRVEVCSFTEYKKDDAEVG